MKPNCCTKAVQYIRWVKEEDEHYFENSILFTLYFTGWGILWAAYDSTVVGPLSYCPFCGKKLDVIND